MWVYDGAIAIAVTIAFLCILWCCYVNGRLVEARWNAQRANTESEYLHEQLSQATAIGVRARKEHAAAIDQRDALRERLNKIELAFEESDDCCLPI
jgi:hypothetical protein